MLLTYLLRLGFFFGGFLFGGFLGLGLFRQLFGLGGFLALCRLLAFDRFLALGLLLALCRLLAFSRFLALGWLLASASAASAPTSTPLTPTPTASGRFFVERPDGRAFLVPARLDSLVRLSPCHDVDHVRRDRKVGTSV